jgi:hypothetical protein
VAEEEEGREGEEEEEEERRNWFMSNTMGKSTKSDIFFLSIDFMSNTNRIS